jgi:hypothetical protein
MQPKFLILSVFAIIFWAYLLGLHFKNACVMVCDHEWMVGSV